MSIIIFGDAFSFPEGDAATNRVHTYAKGFYENGMSVHIICFDNNYNVIKTGSIHGIKFHHPFGQSERNKFFIIRRWQKFIKYINAVILVNKINKKDKIVVFNCWTQSLLVQLFTFILAKLCKSSLIVESSEHPLRYYQDNLFEKIYGKLKLYLIMKSSNGIFCISRYLIDFYQNKGYNQKKLLLVPSTVDPSRFNRSHEKLFQNPYIGYFGGLTFMRDNIDLLVKAFAQITDEHPEIHLVLGGLGSEFERKQLKDLIIQLNIEDKVKLLNYLKREEVINYITQAKVLVMVRGNDLASKASFPSKLTEFLATSNPVISVNVGEIADYLTDNENVFLVEPGNIYALSEKLNFVLSNYEFAKRVSAKGKELTDTIFNYNFQAKRMIDFTNLLSNAKS